MVELKCHCLLYQETSLGMRQDTFPSGVLGDNFKLLNRGKQLIIFRDLKFFLSKKRRFRLCRDSSPGLLITGRLL